MSEPDAAPPEEPARPLVTGLYRLVVLLALVAIGTQAARHMDIGVLWDDAYIFQRYAARLSAGLGLSWQPSGEPVYGLTSVLYVIPALVAQKLAPDYSVAAMAPSVTFGVLFIAALFWLLLRHVPGPRAAARAGLVLGLVCIAISSTPIHFVTGMDTTFGMTFQVIHLVLAARFVASPTRARAVTLGVVGGLAFWVRPELLAFAMLLPAACAFRPAEPAMRKEALIALGAAAGTLAVILAVNAAYFGTALPLPFFAKSVARYDSGLGTPYRGVAVQHFFHFAGFYWPLFSVIAIELLSRPRTFLREAGPLVLGVLTGLVVVVGYHMTAAIPIMAMSERFYQVAVVPLVYLSARIVVRWAERLSTMAVNIPLVQAAALAGLSLLLWPKLVEHVTEANWKLARTRLNWNLDRHARSKGPRSYWFKLDEMSKLPHDAVFATTEVGMLGILNLDRVVIDLAGLNEPRFSRAPFDAAVLLGEMKPDLIYMPHQDYSKMVSDIVKSPLFEGYEHYTKKRTKTNTFGIAIRKDSKHYQAIHNIAKLEAWAKPNPLRAVKGR